MVKSVCLVGCVSLIVGCILCSVMTVDKAGLVNNIWVASCFGFKVVIVGSLVV